MQTIADRLLYRVIAGVLAGFSYLPIRFAYRLGGWLGALAYLVCGRRRRVALQNVALALEAQMTPVEQRGLIRETFRGLGWHLIDFCRMRHLTPKRFARICTLEGFERVQALLARQQGLLVISAHFGSWELAAAAALQLDTPAHMIIRRPKQGAFRRVVEDYRQRAGFALIPHREALARSVQALRRGEVVVVLMDQSSLRREAVEVEFFGVKTFTSKGPALIALRSGCAVIGAFLVRDAPGQHRLVFTQEIPLQRTHDLRQDIEVNTCAFNRMIESYIRRYPDHWFWLHRRWKDRPK
jgi:KDO2-lipid IV(A) lauroyltransferase